MRQGPVGQARFGWVRTGQSGCGSFWRGRYGLAQRVRARRVTAWQARMARHGKVRWGAAGGVWPGVVSHGWSRLGQVRRGRRGGASPVSASLGPVRLGTASRAKAGQGVAGVARTARCGVASSGEASRGKLWRGQAGIAGCGSVG